ncbi:hypothetical protein ABIF66_002344 [Bradyrhizobium japonicum]
MAGAYRWKVRVDAGLRPDITVAIRMNQMNSAILDYYLLHGSRWRQTGSLWPSTTVSPSMLTASTRSTCCLSLLLVRNCWRFAMGSVQSIEIIPINTIDAANPRARNRRIFKEIVTSVAELGLKRPITVKRKPGEGEARYELVCGQGRLEAYQTLGQREILP